MMVDTINVTELILGGVVVYRRELSHPKNETIVFRQYVADAITGKETTGDQ